MQTNIIVICQLQRGMAARVTMLTISLFISIILLVESLPIDQHQPVASISKSEISRRLLLKANQPSTKGALCTACRLIVQGIQYLLKQNATDESIDEFASNLCKGLHIEPDHVCDAITQAYGLPSRPNSGSFFHHIRFQSEVYFVLGNAIFTPEEICGGLVTDCGGAVNNPLHANWSIEIPANKPIVRPWPTPAANAPKLRVLHLSDIHIDRRYAIGSESDCEKPTYFEQFSLCCRDNNISTQNPNAKVLKPAGKWGTVARCDLPFRTFDSALRHISTTEHLDYIIITGDFEAHDPWDYSQNLTLSNIANITATLLQYFPNTPIFEAVGNHEGVPSDAMAPHTMPEYGTRGPGWLYNGLAQAWSNWLPPKTNSEIQYRASYSFRPFVGLKFISINSVYCSEFNFYLYMNEQDPDDTLAWLVNELSESEHVGEKVHIISHIPSGSSYCLKSWAHNFYDIVNRFENTIAAQFYGHTHSDEFQVFYENSDPSGRASHFNFIAPSLTTESFRQPSYRIYTIDGNYTGSTWTVLDSETYMTNVTEANINGQEPVWSLEYNTRQAFAMPDFSPASWNDLINRMQTDDTLFQKYLLYYNRNEPTTPCDAECKRNFICGMKMAKSHETDHFCR